MPAEGTILDRASSLEPSTPPPQGLKSHRFASLRRKRSPPRNGHAQPPTNSSPQAADDSTHRDDSGIGIEPGGGRLGHSNKKTGGFLLDSAWGSIRRTRPHTSAARSTSPPAESSPLANGTFTGELPAMHASEHPRTPDRGGKLDGVHFDGASSSNGRASRDSHSSKRLRIYSADAASSSTTRSSRDGVHRPRTRDSHGTRTSRISSDSPRAHSSNVDTSQLVRVAMSLNESRRMHLAPGQIASVETPTGRRAVSLSVNPTTNSALAGSYQQHLRDARRAERQISLGNGRVGEHLDHQGTLPSGASPERQSSKSIMPAFEERDLHFSAGTLERADKARAYFELCHQYRRTLECLPPLRHPHHKTFHFPEHQVAHERQYNPLQYIRNRKVRVREQQELDGGESGWDDLRNVSLWVGALEHQSRQQGFAAYDVVKLPKWNFQGLASTKKPVEMSPDQAEAQARRLRAAQSKKNALDWSFAPADLLADVYWSEQSRHKGLLEDRHGDKLYPRLQTPRKEVKSPKTIKSYDEEDEEDDDGASNHSDGSSPEAPAPGSSPLDDSSPRQHGRRHRHHFFHRSGRTGRLKGRVLGRRRKESIDHSDLSNSEGENESPEMARARQASSSANFAPLEAHMARLIQQETHRSANFAASKEQRPRTSDGQSRRLGISGDPNEERFSPASPDEQLQHVMDVEGQYEQGRGSASLAPRISVDNYDTDVERSVVGTRPSTSREVETDGPADRRPSSRRFSFLRQYRSSEHSERAFSTREPPKTPPAAAAEDDGGDMFSARSSMHNSSRSGSTHQLPKLVPLPTGSRPASPSRTPGGAKSFWKGGRIGEIVRSERSGRPGSFQAGHARRHSHRHDSISSTLSNHASEMSRSEEHLSSPSRKAGAGEASQRPSLASHGRSHSSSEVRSAKARQYHLDNLPTFVSTKVSSPKAETARGEEGARERRQSARGRVPELRRATKSHLAPEASGANSSEVSPNTSSPDLSRYATNKSYGFPAPGKQHSRSSSGVREATRRLSDILAAPSDGGSSPRRRSLSPRATVAESRSKSRPEADHRGWSIAQAQRKQREGQQVTARQIAYVRSMLISSGAKATAIVSRANAVVLPPSPFLVRAADLCQMSLAPARRREEHAIAARLLSQDLESSLRAFEHAADLFGSAACGKLRDELQDLQERANSSLTPQVRSIEEEADAFVAELTTTHTLAIKQVNDSLNHMQGTRRRRLRWLAGAGFRLLEWTVVAFMWCIWLLVLLIRILRGLTLGAVRGVRWMLWLG